VDLTQWLVAEHDETAVRLRGQVLDLVPAGRRAERPGGGNPILWSTFHLTRHAALALDVLEPGAAPPAPDWLPQLAGPDASAVPVAGLEEAPAPWAGELPAAEVDTYLNQVLDHVRGFLANPGLDFYAVPDVAFGLGRAGIGPDDVPWLRRMWTGQQASWIIRWPLTGHIGNHVGEMLATRNRMGLSPF
jgi:hypothetical protein